jgi:hypothetical protein
VNPSTVFAIAGWTLAALLARVVWYAVREAQRNEVWRAVKGRTRLSDTPHMRFASTWEPSA